MIVEMKVPSPGESITEVQIARWLKKDGDYVEKDEEICEIDSDKATLTLNAEASGQIKLLVKEGDTIEVGKAVCSINTDIAAPAQKEKNEQPVEKSVPQSVQEKKAAPIEASNGKPVNESVESKKENYSQGIPSVAAEKIMREKGLSS